MGAIANALAIVGMGFLGKQFGRAIPERISQGLMQAIGLAVLAIGVSGALKGANGLVMVLSLVLGTFLGQAIDIDQRILQFVDQVEKRWMQGLSPRHDQALSKGFISATMIFCVGSMVIVGSLESGIYGNHTTLYTKSIMDGITALLLASSLGAGVLLSSVPVLLIEGGLTLLASWLLPFLTDLAISEMVSVGSIVLVALALNLMGLSHFKVMNFTPAIFMPILLTQLSFLI